MRVLTAPGHLLYFGLDSTNRWCAGPQARGSAGPQARGSTAVLPRQHLVHVSLSAPSSSNRLAAHKPLGLEV